MPPAAGYETWQPSAQHSCPWAAVHIAPCSLQLNPSRAPLPPAAGYETCQPKLFKILERLVFVKDITQDYTYYGIPSPWLQCKVLRLLQYFPPLESSAQEKQLHDIISAIVASKWLACSSASTHAHAQIRVHVAVYGVPRSSSCTASSRLLWPVSQHTRSDAVCMLSGVYCMHGCCMQGKQLHDIISAMMASGWQAGAVRSV